MAIQGASFRDLFVDRNSPEGRDIFGSAVQHRIAGRQFMVIKGVIFPGSSHPRSGQRIPWAVKVDVTLGEDDFWRGYYESMRRLVRKINQF